MQDYERDTYIECAVRAIVKAGTQLRERLGVGFAVFHAPGGHEVTAESIDVESTLEGEFRKGQISNKKLRERNPKATLLTVTESSDLKKELVERWGEDILQEKSRDPLEFIISDCPDGSTKHGNFSRASCDGLPISASPPTTVNMTLYEKGTTFGHITANITYTLEGDLVIVKKNNNGIIEFLMYGQVTRPIQENKHPQKPSADVLRRVYAANTGTICAAIMTNDNYGCMEISEEVRQNLHKRCNGISRVRFESTGSSILDQHLSLYRNYNHLLIDLRGLFPDQGPVLDPAEAGAHYLAFKELGWECRFRDIKTGRWEPLGEFDILDDNYRTEGADGSVQYGLTVAYYSPSLPNKPLVMRTVADSVNSILQKQK